MKLNWRHTRLALVSLAVCATIVALIAWTGGPANHVLNNYNDTIPTKKPQARSEKENRDFDKELKAIEHAEKELEALHEKDWDKLGEEIGEAIGRIDFGRIGLEIDEAMSHLDKDISKEISEAMKEVDMEKIGRDIERSLEDLDDIEQNIDFDAIRNEMKKAEKEVKESLARSDWKKNLDEFKKTDWKALQQEIAEAMDEVKDIKVDLKDMDLDLGKHMEDAGKEIKKAKEELKAYQEMVYEMEKDKLLDTRNDYTIRFRDGGLYINGQKQTEAITEKYKKYFRKNTTIKKRDGDININSGNDERDHVDPA
jgi:hypothetical protein